ncbi:metallophosphoesterase [Nocardia sp. CC201C]|uniref:metallophosphoesterase family protein n=1 Tax=Nocardia sp. CC201C TaxID=3044575 RepID=UPI0024A8251C|nr:metallophosphoesterase [Nocardia sp. CC201C]
MVDPLLRTVWLANVAAGAAALTVRTPVYRRSHFTVVRVESARPQRDSVRASDLEVVTVTDTSVVLTWTTRTRDRLGRPRPVPADTEVRIGPADGVGSLPVRFADTRRTAYHYAEVTGLEPGRSYRFEAYSDGVRARPARTLVTLQADAPESTGVVTTATPPPGRLLRTIALANDIHFGERESGLFLPGVPSGMRHEDEDHPDMMLGAVLDDLRTPDRAADHLVVAGDLTDEGSPEQSRGVRDRLDGWGALGRDYFVCRGNHDQLEDADDDPWGSVFHPHQRLVDHELGGLRLIGLDTTRPRGAGGILDADQRAALRELLAAEPDRPTLVFGHHPVTAHAAVSNSHGPGFVLDRASAAALHALYRAAPGVFLHHSGHTHRTRRTRPDTAVGVEFLEIASVKEYPGGYVLLRVYEGGYTVNFYKTRAMAARRWSTRTRRQYLGLLPDYALGSCADRNHVVPRDFSGLR